MITKLDRSNELIAKYMNEYEQAEADLSLEEKMELITELIKYQRNLAEIKKYQAQQSKPTTKIEKKDYYMSILRSNAGWKSKEFKGMKFEQIEEKFIPESSKKLKTAKASSSEPSQEQQTKEPKEPFEEELKKMIAIEIWLGLIMYRIPCTIKGVLSLDLSKVTITLKAKALDLSLGSTPFSQDPKSSHDDESKPSSDNGKKVDEDPRKESECNNQEKKDNVNAAGTNEVNAVGENISIELPFDPTMPALEDDSIFEFSNYDKNDGAMADMNNLDTTI
ncbi:hypothetical protein Tco_1405644 [Tanacetum coccineum]